MSSKPWPWVVPETDQEMVHRLALSLDVHYLTAACLLQRGVSTEEEARFFLHGTLSDLSNPFTMAGARKAAERLARAVESGEPVLVCGDYDADGVTSVALLTSALQNLGVTVEYYIPSRLDEGYGLHGRVLQQFAARDGRLALTVDCGINSFAEMDLARELGLDLIITDHHECFFGERSAYAVLNPKQADCRYPERNLAGVGVAWTLLRALHIILKIPFSETAEFLDLVAVGSIADVVPLLGENRILVKYGLEKLQTQPLPGLDALIRISGMGDSKLTASQVAFTVAPRLNAPGRLGDADPAVRTLLAEAAEAEALARELDDKNRLRQQVEKDILEQARQQADSRSTDPALVLWHADWHAGVVGIVAGRLAQEFAKPAALIAVSGEEGHGSIRSVPGCNVVEALQACTGHLLRYGGHPEAAGLSVAVSELEAFRQAFCHAVSQQGAAEITIPVAAEAEPSVLTLPLVDELASLEPFGQGNPEPLFLLRNVSVKAARRVGSRKNHLQLKFQKNSPVIAAICFGGGDSEIKKDMCVDAVVVPAANTWQGQTSLSLQVRGMRVSPVEESLVVTDKRGMDKDKLLAELIHQHHVIVWVNTKAAKDYLTTRFGSRLNVTQLGRNLCGTDCEILFFYHLPFDPVAVRRLFAGLCFSGQPTVYLYYNGEDLMLNEKIFAATVPEVQTLRQLAAGLQDDISALSAEAARNVLTFPVTQHLLSQAQAIVSEAAAGVPPERQALLQNLEHSPTYRESCKAMAVFRTCQMFWLHASASEIAGALTSPHDFILPKGEEHNERERTKRTN